MSGCGKTLLVLVAIAPVLTEIVSGNTPAHALLNPRITIFLLLAYSLPVLIIRELAIRWRLSVLGLFLWGLAYGILNEGLLAQTLIRFEHVPINKFDGYIVLGGFNLSWACLILPWHALFAVVFPISLVHYWFPNCAGTTWMTKGLFRVFASVLMLLIAFISVMRIPHPQMLVCLLAMVLLFFLGYVFRSVTAVASSPAPRAMFLIGILSYAVMFLGLIIFASIRVPPLLYFGAAAASFVSFGRISSARGFWNGACAAKMGLGFYFAAAAFCIVGAIAHHSAETVISGSLLACVLLGLVYLPGKAAYEAV